MKKLNNKQEEEKEILKDLKLSLDEGDTHNINDKVSHLFDNLEEGMAAWDAGTEIAEILNYVLSGEFGIENADEIADRIMEEIRSKGIII